VENLQEYTSERMGIKSLLKIYEQVIIEREESRRKTVNLQFNKKDYWKNDNYLHALSSYDPH